MDIQEVVILIVEKCIVVMCIGVVLKEDDFEIVYFYVMLRFGGLVLVELNLLFCQFDDMWFWNVVLKVGQYICMQRFLQLIYFGMLSVNLEIWYLEQCLECLVIVLWIVFVLQLFEILKIFCCCEEQFDFVIVEEVVKEDVWDVVGDVRSVFGLFEQLDFDRMYLL